MFYVAHIVARSMLPWTYDRTQVAVQVVLQMQGT